MPKIVDHEERRNAIAAAAADQIAAVGIEAVTMKGIAAGAGVTTGAVTHYFADKDEVVVAALLLVDAAMQRRYETALALGDEPVDALLAALPTDPESIRDWRVWQVFADHATRNDALMDQLRAAARGWTERAAAAIADEFGCDPADAAVEADLLNVVVDGIGDAACIDPESWPIARQRAVLDRYLRRAFVAVG